ncbi:MAG: SH3-like domain-containing protein [Paracoccaceae bacterium]
MVKASGIALAVALALILGAAAAAPGKGPVTGFDMPRYVSLKTDRANVRRGPALEHRVDWEFLRRDMPLRVVAEHGSWRRVQDLDDVAGWVHSALLSGTRTVIVTKTPESMLRKDPDADAPPVARVEQGVILRLLACRPLWCLLEAHDHEGWALKADLWGVDGAEAFE